MSLHKKNGTIKYFKIHCLLLVLSLFTSCNKEEDAVTLPQDAINGFWSIEDKGWFFEFKEGNDVFYNTNAAGCSIQNDDFVLQDFFGFDFDLISENELIASSELSDTEIKFVRLPNQNPKCLPDQISDTDDPKINFDHFWNIFNDYYAFFEVRKIDWSQYESMRDQVTNDNLYELIETLAYTLDDGHVSITDDDKNVDIQSGNPTLFKNLNANLSGNLIINNEEDYNVLFNQKAETIVTEYLGGAFEIDERENIIWGLINDNIGYILVSTMEGYGTDFNNEISSLNTVLDTIMNDLNDAGVSKVIIDVRFNNGGFDTVALDIASRFMDKERVSYFKKARLGDGFTENIPFSIAPKGDFQFTDEIVVLTSSFTISAAELFTLCLKDLPYVTIVGENTTGSFSTILEHTLPNGAQIGLSNEIYSDAKGAVFEVIGIGPEEPENRVPFLTNSDFEQEKDTGIEHAIEILND